MEENRNGQENGTLKKDVEPFNFNRFGVEKSAQSQGEINSLLPSLQAAYSHFLIESELDEISIQKKIKRTEEEIQLAKEKKEEATGDINKLELNKNELRDKKNNLLSEKDKKESEGPPKPETFFLVIECALLIFLTLYLFLFYSTNGYSVLYKVEPSLKALIDFGILRKALNQSPESFLFICFFPSIFLGVGVLIHRFMDKKNIGALISFCLITLIADILIAFIIAKKIYEMRYLNEIETEPWNWKMVLSQEYFYFVILLGFVAYLIWGFLLHFVVKTIRDSKPERALQVILDDFDRRINDVQSDINEKMAAIETSKTLINNLNSDIDQKSKNVVKYRNIDLKELATLIDVSSFKGKMGDFLTGWNSYYTFRFVNENEKREEVSNEAKSIYNNWITTTINHLEPVKNNE